MSWKPPLGFSRCRASGPFRLALVKLLAWGHGRDQETDELPLCAERDVHTWTFRDVDCWVSEKGREKDIRDELGPGMLAVSGASGTCTSQVQGVRSPQKKRGASSPPQVPIQGVSHWPFLLIMGCGLPW